MLTKAALLVLLMAAPVAAQVQSRPTDPPPVTAANESWYLLREPIQFAGDLYYRAGAAVYFDGNTMVRTGHYNGIPLYMDTTVEPYSVILVPVRRGLVQPYERLRRGDLAGTTASRTPSFPVRATPDALTYLPQAAISPTQPQRPIGAIGAFTPEDAVPVRSASPVGTVRLVADEPMAPQPPGPPMVSLLQPENNDGLWVHYAGARYVSSGAAVPLASSEFRTVGQYDGFPVYTRAGDDKTIYLPTRAGLVAPYRVR